MVTPPSYPSGRKFWATTGALTDGSCRSMSLMAALKSSSLLARSRWVGGGAGAFRYLAIVRRPIRRCRAILRAGHFSEVQAVDLTDLVWQKHRSSVINAGVSFG